MPVDEFAEGDGHFFFHRAGVVDVAADAEEFGPLVALAAEGGEPLGAAARDGWADGDGLDVGDGGWAAEESDGGREGGLEARLACFAFEGFDQTGLLTADICAHATVHVDVEVVAAAAGVLADEAVLVCLLDRALEHGRLVVELAPDVDVGGGGVHGAADDEAALDELVRVLAHDLAVLAGSGLALVGVDDEVAGFGVFVPVFEVHEGLEGGGVS